MTILLIIGSIAFTVAMTILMLQPFSISKNDQVSFELLDEELREVESLVARKVSLVQSLRDIEYDWETSKISEDDYNRFTRSCERQAIAVMRRLDSIHGGEHDWESTIEAGLSQRRKLAGQQFEDNLATDSQTQPKTPAPTSETDSDSVPDCVSCGVSLQADDRFCAQCGTPVESVSDKESFEPLSNSSRPPEVAG